MDSKSIIRNMETIVRSLREQLHRNECISKTSLGCMARLSFHIFKASLARSATMKTALESFKTHMSDFEQGLLEGDTHLAGLALERLEQTVTELKERYSPTDNPRTPIRVPYIQE